NIMHSVLTHWNPPNKKSPCHLINLRTLKLSTRSDGRPSESRSELLALRSSRNSVRKSSIRPIGRGAKSSLILLGNIPAQRFTMHLQAKASFLFTLAMKTKAYGIFRAAALDHCRWEAGS